jgi:hypothetical protein
VLNRGAILLRYREPMIRWINGADPSGKGPSVTAESLVNDCRVYLVADESCEHEAVVEEWVHNNCEALFREELSGWYIDESLWPAPLNWHTFQQWFRIEFHSSLVDTVEGPLYDDEI